MIIHGIKSKSYTSTFFDYHLLLTTVESLEFVATQFSWYSRVALPHEFTFSAKTNFERVNFLTETETDASTNLHPDE